MARFLNWTSRFDWMWLGEDQRVNNHKDACLKEIGERLQTFDNYSILNREHNWEKLCN